MDILKRTLIMVFLLLAASCAQREEISITLVHYNVGVFSKTDSSSVEAVADAVRELDADIVSLNELDSCALRTGSTDQLGLFAAAMGEWNSNFAAAMPFMGGKYGVGVASSPDFEVLKTDVLHLPRFSGTEPRAVSVVEFEDFVLASTHLDYKSAEVQIAQIEVVNHYVDSLYASSSKPIILCGDFNCLPESEPVSLMEQTWQKISPSQPTYPAVSPEKCIDYIFVRPNGNKIHVDSASVPTTLTHADLSTVSDHLPVVVNVTIRR